MGDVANDERAAIVVPAVGLERAFGGVERRGRKLVPERRESVVAVVIDEEHGAGASHAALGLDVAGDTLHRDVQDLGVRRAQRAHAEALGEGPAGVVVRILLRIVRAPVLVVEQGVGDARVGLIHADDVAAGGELARLRRCDRRRRRAVACGASAASAAATSSCCGLPNDDRHRECLRRPGYLDGLFLQYAQELRLRASARFVGGQHVCRWAFCFWF